MPTIILFEDNPDAPADLRAAHMPAHLAFLQAHADRIRAAGPLADPSGAAAGGLWIVDVETPAEAERLVREDPFWPTGLRRSVRILEWRQVFVDGAPVARARQDPAPESKKGAP